MLTTPPNISVTHNQNKIETERGQYNWFDKEKGGNTSFADIPESLVKNLKAATIKKDGDIHVTFNTSWKQPNKLTVNLVLPNQKNQQNFGLREQKLNENSFRAPKESGQYIYLITGYWDETHSVDYALKINIQ